jgi:hypothetical protein
MRTTADYDPLPKSLRAKLMSHCVLEIMNAHTRKNYFVSVITENREIRFGFNGSLESQTARVTLEALVLHTTSATSFTGPLLGLGCINIPEEVLDYEAFCSFMRIFARYSDICSIIARGIDAVVQKNCDKWGLSPELITLPSVFSPRRLPYILLFDNGRTTS